MRVLDPDDVHVAQVQALLSHHPLKPQVPDVMAATGPSLMQRGARRWAPPHDDDDRGLFKFACRPGLPILWSVGGEGSMSCISHTAASGSEGGGRLDMALKRLI